VKPGRRSEDDFIGGEFTRATAEVHLDAGDLLGLVDEQPAGMS
jgi:hypothetical protein